MTLRITRANFIALMQDRGRCARHMGFTSGGAMDQSSHAVANALVDNFANQATIEVTYGAFELRAEEATWVGIAGADLYISHNGQLINSWRNLYLQAGDVLSFSQPKDGLRCYIAIPGGFATDRYYGSRSTVLREKLPGMCGRRLAVGDVLHASTVTNKTALLPRAVPPFYRPDFGFEEVMDVPFYPTYQWHLFSDAAQSAFLAREYVVGSSSNRMGYRLEGEPIDHDVSRLVSEGISVGSIQLPQDGCPIVLMRDHPTVGGYPKLGVLSEAGINTLAQMAHGKKLRFTPEYLSAP